MTLLEELGCNDHTAGRELVLDLLDSKAPSRDIVEHFIHQVFDRAYNADLQHFLPRLMALRDKNNHPLAALGMREASSGPLFLETYFDDSVEDVISRLHGSRVARDRIVEVGNLASVHRGGLSKLIVALTSFLRGAGTEWVVFTAVPAVRSAFTALGLTLHTLAEADPSCLDERERDSWGDYYETGPMVVAGRVEEGYLRLSEILNVEHAFRFNCYLWEYAFIAGCRLRFLNSSTVIQPGDGM